MVLLFYISGHGFGHAARDIEVVNAIALHDRSVRIVLRTAVPEWFLRAARFYRDFPDRVERERDLIGGLGARLVVGDIPPLAFAAADAASVPSIAFGNFTWDCIYEAYPQFDTIAPGVTRLIEDASAKATLALRLPFAGGFASMSRVEDVPLVARRASVSKDDTRRRLGLAGDRPIVLATFGGHRGGVPLNRAAAPNVRVVSADALAEAKLTYTDLLAAADVVATKLGYGIVSECLANGVALLYTLRGRFVEQDVFMREMPAVMRCRHIDRDALCEGAGLSRSRRSWRSQCRR